MHIPDRHPASSASSRSGDWSDETLNSSIALVDQILPVDTEWKYGSIVHLQMEHNARASSEVLCYRYATKGQMTNSSNRGSARSSRAHRARRMITSDSAHAEIHPNSISETLNTLLQVLGIDRRVCTYDRCSAPCQGRRSSQQTFG